MTHHPILPSQAIEPGRESLIRKLSTYQLVNGFVQMPHDFGLSDLQELISILAVLDAQQHSGSGEAVPLAWMWRCKPYCDWPKWAVSIVRPMDAGCTGGNECRHSEEHAPVQATKGYEDFPLTAARTASLAQADGKGEI
jgi:hypothetical protein